MGNDAKSAGNGTCASVGSGLQFCSECDYAISRIEMGSFRFDIDKAMCPRCGMCRLSMFYSYGSDRHRNRRELWERGGVTGAPLPFPNVKVEFSERSEASER